MSKQQSAESLRTRIQSIDPYEFEDFVAEVWEVEGWDTTVSRRSADMGVDVVAEKSGTIDQKLAIQTKRYTDGNKVGRPEIQQYHSLKEQDTDADAAVVVTSGSFTSDGELWAMKNNVKVVDGDDLAERIRMNDMVDRLDEYANDSGREESTRGGRGDESAADAILEAVPSMDKATDNDSPSLGFIIVGGGLAAWATVLFFAFHPDATLLSGVSTFLWIVCGLSLFTFPIGIFLDSVQLHHRDADWKPNRVVWPAIGFFAVLIGPLVYFLMRVDRVDP